MKATVRLTDFGGGMNDSPVSGMAANQLSLMQNCRPDMDGTITIRKARSLLNTTVFGSSSIWGMARFQPSTGDKQWVAFCGTKAYKSTDYGVTWTEIATGLTEAYWTFAIMSDGATRYLLCANGSSSTYKWDGTTWGTVTNIPADTKYICTHNSRLYATTGEDSTLYASAIEDFETWDAPDGLILPIETYDGAPISAIASFGTALVVFKRDSMAYVDGFGNSDIIIAAGSRGISDSVGCLGQRTIVTAGGAMYWLSRRGIEKYVMGMDEPQLMSRNVRVFLSGGFYVGRDSSDPLVPHAAFHPTLNEVWMAIPYSAPDYCDYIVKLNTLTGALCYDHIGGHSAMMVDKANAGHINDSVIAGSSGYVYALEGTSGRDEYGTSGVIAQVNVVLRTAPLDFGFPGRQKRVREVRVIASGSAIWSVKVLANPTSLDLDGTPSSSQAFSAEAAMKAYRTMFSTRGTSVSVELSRSFSLANLTGAKIHAIEIDAEVLNGTI